MSVMGPDPTGEREELYSYLEDLAADREQNERGRGLSNIVRQMNYVENHFLSAVAEKYPALIKKVFGRKRFQELKEEQEARMASEVDIARGLLDVARELTSSVIEGDTSLDGMRKTQAKNHVNKLLHTYTKGLFKDDSWKPVNLIWRALDHAVINWEMQGSKYFQDREGRPNAKEWKFEVYFNDNNGRFKTLYGIIRAAGAGSVEYPLDKYDLIAYVS